VLLPLTSQIATGIVKLGQEGGGEITMRLQPANLGRVDVSMKFDDGRMTAMITADRQDTLDLLRRDAYGLERSLADAGLKMDGGGLEFSLRGDGGQRDRDDDTGRGSRTAAQIPAETELAPANPTRRTSGLSRLDMRI
jgi:flagellar hook-length control protein FliK